MPAYLNQTVSGVKGSSLLYNFTTPIGIACTGNINANGALNLAGGGVAAGTLPRNYGTCGMWLYFPANAVLAAGNSAGFYWCVMTSATAGQVYGNTWEPTTSLNNAPPETLISLTGLGKNANYSGVTSAVTIFSVPIPAGILGISGGLLCEMEVASSNLGSTKSPVLKWGASSNVMAPSLSGTSFAFRGIGSVRNAGQTGKQHYTSGGGTFGASTSLTTAIASEDTTAAVTLLATGQISSNLNGECLMFDTLTVELQP